VLPRAHRLTASDDFRRAVKSGRRAGSATLVVHLGAGVGTAARRAGFVVSRSVGDAVHRNRVKRQLRHLAREQLDLLPPAALLVVRAQPAAAGASYAELRDDLERCVTRVMS
jgi:ribonuclease P protein component